MQISDLRKLQLLQLDMLKEVDRICRKHDIKYSLAAGTLLGAVRHKGFIPWDDDTDIVMDRKNYSKFKEVCKIELDEEKFFLQDILSDSHYRYIFSQLRLKKTLYLRKGEEHMLYHQGIPIDIWISEFLPKNIVLRYIATFIIARCKTILYSPIGVVKGRTLFLRITYKLLSFIPKQIPYKMITSICNFSEKKGVKTAIGSPNFSIKRVHRSNKILRKRPKDINPEIEFTELEFEGSMFLAFSNYDELLRFSYGDYMILPPETERIGHHTASEIDFGDF